MNFSRADSFFPIRFVRQYGYTQCYIVFHLFDGVWYTSFERVCRHHKCQRRWLLGFSSTETCSSGKCFSLFFSARKKKYKTHSNNPTRFASCIRSINFFPSCIWFYLLFLSRLPLHRVVYIVIFNKCQNIGFSSPLDISLRHFSCVEKYFLDVDGEIPYEITHVLLHVCSVFFGQFLSVAQLFSNFGLCNCNRVAWNKI